MDGLLELFGGGDFGTLAYRFLQNLFFVLLVVRGVYYPIRKDKDFLFTYLIFNTLVFFICYLMSSIDLGVGFGFGLFALFAILRYRTVTLPVKEMTYLFAVITIAVLNAIITESITNGMLFAVNACIFVLIFLLDKVFGEKLKAQYIVYEKIENIKPESYDALLEDLISRTGLDIRKVEMSDINFLNDTIKVKIYYQPATSDFMANHNVLQ